MECINGSDVFYFDDSCHECFFKKPYNHIDYSLLVQIYDDTKDKYYLDFIDPDDVDYLLYSDYYYTIYILHKKDLSIVQIK